VAQGPIILEIGCDPDGYADPGFLNSDQRLDSGIFNGSLVKFLERL